jgi:hypothetical protein
VKARVEFGNSLEDVCTNTVHGIRCLRFEHEYRTICLIAAARANFAGTKELVEFGTKADKKADELFESVTDGGVADGVARWNLSAQRRLAGIKRSYCLRNRLFETGQRALLMEMRFERRAIKCLRKGADDLRVRALSFRSSKGCQLLRQLGKHSSVHEALKEFGRMTSERSSSSAPDHSFAERKP